MPQFAENTNEPAVYFKTLYMMNVRCFKGIHKIDLNDGSSKPTQWTVVLGNNNTGKTTILRILAGLEYSNNIGEADANGITTKGYKRDTILMPRSSEYISFNEKISFIGSQLISCVNKSHSILKNQYYKPILSIFSQHVQRNTPVAKFITAKDLELFGEIDISSAILAGIDMFGQYLYPENIEMLDYQKIYGYGTSRFMSNNGVSDDSTAGLFDNKTELLNAEKWLVDLHVAKTSKFIGAEARYKQVIDVFCNGLLPDVTRIHIKTIPDKSSYDTFPVFLTSYGLVRLRDLGYGYQATLAWVADLAKRMFDRYPDLENPLHGPAVVLVDEIDLHLHPEWQRTVVKYLSDLFPNTQFIVTAHSPLIVQSAKDVNVIMLEKDNDNINIRQRFGSFQGWTVDEILTELMQLGERTRSDRYLDLMKEFENAALNNNHEKAQAAYNELDAILSPSSYQRKVLQIQMSSLPLAL